MKFKVGDKVRVRKDLEVGKEYDGYYFIKEMAEYKGRVGLIKTAYCYDFTCRYTLDIDDGKRYYTDEMLEPAKENTMELKVNFENLNEEEKERLLALVEKANKPKSKVWKPKTDEKYWFVDSTGAIDWNYWSDCGVDNYRYTIGNCFETEEEAEFALENLKILAELQRYAKKHNECEIDWNEREQIKWQFDYAYGSERIVYYSSALRRTPILPYFTSEIIAKQAVKEVGEERIKKYLFGVE